MSTIHSTSFRFNVGQQVSFEIEVNRRNYVGSVVQSYAAIGGNRYDVRVKHRGIFRWIAEEMIVAAPEA